MTEESKIPPGGEDTAAEDAEEGTAVDAEEGSAAGPERMGEQDAEQPSPPHHEVISRRRKVVGIGLIALGVLFLLDEFFDLGDYLTLWPILLVVLGLVLLLRSPAK